MLEDALSVPSLPDMPVLAQRLQTLLRSVPVLNFLRELICNPTDHLPLIRRMLAKSNNSAYAPLWVESLLDPSGSMGLRTLRRTEKVEVIVTKADQISLTISSLALHAYEESTPSQIPSGEDLTGALLSSLIERAANGNDDSVHYRLLSGLDSSTKRKLFAMCEVDILDGFDPTDSVVSDGLLLTHMNVIKHTLEAVDHEQDASISIRLIEKLRLASQDYNRASQQEQIGPKADSPQGAQRRIKTWLVVFCA
jgi:hypothetical protein